MPARAKTPTTPAKSAIHAKTAGRPKAAPAKETPAKRARPFRRKTQKAKSKIRKGKYTLKLKGWLKTPADWTRFNAWAKINAQPKKYPEPEPIVRPSKPLSQLKKRLKVLATAKETPDLRLLCRLDYSISKAALKAIPSRRLLLLSLPHVKLCDYGRVFYKVSPAALKYEPSERILALSQPREYTTEKPVEKPRKVSMCGESQRTGIDMDRLNELASSKKVFYIPSVLTPEEIAKLFTSSGVKKRALIYEITPWMNYLALPKYVLIKYRKDKNAKGWKKQIIEEGPKRGKTALSQQQKKQGTKRKRDETETETKEGEEVDKDADDEKEKEERAKKRKLEIHMWRYTPYPCKDDAFSVRKTALKGKAPPGVEKLSKPNVRKSRACKPNPFAVKKGALSASASERTESLAKPNRPLSPVEKKPPREKDAYGRPIFIMPVYGKVLPKTKPYKMGKCPPKEEKKKKIRKKRPIDPIAYETTYDPCIYPDLAKRQKRERKRAEKLNKKKGKKRKRRAKKKGKKQANKQENEQANEQENKEAKEEENEQATEQENNQAKEEENEQATEQENKVQEEPNEEPNEEPEQEE